MNLAHRWDIFCRVIDNYGDIGVCWRLAADLATRGAKVRLWVDDASALDWMAPGAVQGHWPGVRVLAWDQASDTSILDTLAPADVWIEAFGCDIPPAFLAAGLQAAQLAMRAPPIWINLEYLTAERFAERAHGLPSPVMHGIAKGQTKYFYYPGFTPHSGGLLREPDLAVRQARFDRADWLARQGIPWQGEQLVSLFCYEPAALPALLAQWQQGSRPTRLLVTPGRATAAVRAALGDPVTTSPEDGPLRITELGSAPGRLRPLAVGLRHEPGARRRFGDSRAVGRQTAVVANLPATRRRPPRQAAGLPRHPRGPALVAPGPPVLERHRLCCPALPGRRPACLANLGRGSP
jgi:uncharacterized repeat protein (TIGR03837 family)